MVACIGILGTATLAGCFSGAGGYLHNGGAGEAPYYVTRPTEQETTQYTMPATEQDITTTSTTTTTARPATATAYTGSYTEFDLNVRVHTGGFGSGPFYVVHLTEAEALSIIRAQLEAAGLRFGAAPPELHIGNLSGSPPPNLALDLFDAEKETAAMLISWEDNNRRFASRSFAREVTRAIARQDYDFTTGVFYNPGKNVGWREGGFARGWEGAEEPGPPSEEQKAEARANLVANLNQQTQQFIELLQTEGIL